MSLPEGTPGSRTTYTVEITAREKEACERHVVAKEVVGDRFLVGNVLRKIAALPPKFHVEQSDTPTTPTQT